MITEFYEVAPVLPGDTTTFIHKQKIGFSEQRVVLRARHVVKLNGKLYRVLKSDSAVVYNSFYNRAYVIRDDTYAEDVEVKLVK